MPPELQEAPGTFSDEDSPEQQPAQAELSEEQQSQLKNLCHKFDVRDQWARQIEIMRAALLRFFWVGLQHVHWNADVGMYQVGPSGTGMVMSENLNEEPTFSEDFNIFTGYGKSFIAVFAQNSAPVRMEPDKPKDSRSIAAAEEAEKYVRVYEKFNPPKVQQIEIGRLLWTDGRVVSLTRYSADKARFGVDEEGQPRGQEVTNFYGVLETKVPIYETNFSKWVYCKISEDHDLCYLKEKYSEFADKIAIGSKTSSPNEEIARMSRIATAENVTQLSQDTLKYLVTEDMWWLRPAAFRELDDDACKQFQEMFPDGCQVTFCGDTFVGAKNESMDDHINVMHAMPGTGASRPALGDPEVAVQMEFNDAMNMAAECLKYAIPSIWMDADTATLRAVMEQKAAYGSLRSLPSGLRQPGEPATNVFAPEPTVEPPALFEAWLENLQGPLSQFVTGQQPALFGAQMDDQKTASGYAQARNQALGLMAIVWIPYKSFYAKIVEQAAVCAAKREEDSIATMLPAQGNSQKTEIVEVDVASMKGGFLCSPISDESFPESPADQSAKYTQLTALTAANPIYAAEVGMDLPDNKALANQLFGIPGWTMPDEDDRDLQLEEWAEMQENAGPTLDIQGTLTAQQNQQSQMQVLQQQNIPLPGPPPPVQPVMQSSVPIDPETDNHKVHAEECLRILNSPEGQKIKKATPEIWQDLKLHFLAHKEALAAQMPPPPMPMAPPPHAGAAPKPPTAAPAPNPGATNAAPTPSTT